MKHLKKFNEAIISSGGFGVKEFMKELSDKLPEPPRMNPRDMFRRPFQRPPSISLEEVAEIGSKYDIEIVDYETFFRELSEENKKTAPKKDDHRAPPIFALLNPETKKMRVVFKIPFLDFGLLDLMRHMLDHESIHAGQYQRRNIIFNLPDPNNLKEYFSNQDEIMAFSQSIVDMMINQGRNQVTTENITKNLRGNQLYDSVKANVDEKTLNRYHKYIYLYVKKYVEDNA